MRLGQAIGFARIGVHLLRGSITVAGIYPFVGDRRRLRLKQSWSARLLDILGFRLDADLAGVAPGSLIVANHISWLDVYAINAARPMAFVCKSEVRSWPLIGWLAANTDSLLGESIAAILACRSLTVRLRPTPPLDPNTRHRSELAQAVRGAIAFNLGFSTAHDLPEPACALPGQRPADKPSTEIQSSATVADLLPCVVRIAAVDPIQGVTPITCSAAPRSSPRRCAFKVNIRHGGTETRRSTE